MNTQGIHICEVQDPQEVVKRDDSGAFIVYDQRRYVIRSETPLVQYGNVLTVQPLSDGRFGTLYFENYVGRAEIHGMRFIVEHSKLTTEAFGKMLDGVVRDVADLAFDYESPTALPFDRNDLATSNEVLYHALAYLRHIMQRVDNADTLHGQFLQIARHPHRRLEPEALWTPIAHAANISAAGLLAVARHPERLVPISLESKLQQTGLGRRLAQRQMAQQKTSFPAEILTTARTESFDTHENRLVLHVLRLASDIVANFEGRELLNPDLQADVRAMREQIDWMLSFDFLRDVGPMQMVPSQSSVLQRREGYRDFWGHFLKLSLSAVLTEDHHRWHALLDLKDGALLYELWCFFEVKRMLDSLVGKPEHADLVKTNAERRNIGWAAMLSYHDGTIELAYNRTYSRQSGSYSVTLRPDIVVRAKMSTGWQTLVLDAKLKFAGERLDELGDRDPSEWKRTAMREDLYKMHTYRDAIREAVGAFVLYPGSKCATYPEENGGAAWAGIGAIALDPGQPTPYLRNLLVDFLGV